MNGMNISHILSLAGKVLVLTLVMVVCFMVAAQVSGIGSVEGGQAAEQADPASTLMPVLISSFLQVLVLTVVIMRSRWTGVKLAGAFFVAFYGSMTVIAQVESLVYLQVQLPAGLVPKLFVFGAIVAGLYTAAAIVLLGKTRKMDAGPSVDERAPINRNEWVWKLGLAVVGYLILYYTFGYYVAWKNPAVQTYYRGTDPGSFIAQLGSILEATPWMFPLQAGRALLWVALVLPLVRMLKGGAVEVSIVMGCFMSVWSAQLLFPNPYMPAEVATVHMIETASSNFVFGVLLGWLFGKHHGAAKA